MRLILVSSTTLAGTRNAACLRVIYLTVHQGLDRKSLTRSDLLLDGEIGPDTANDMAVSGGS